MAACEVICTRAIWFEEAKVGGNTVQVRKSASYGEIVEIPGSEVERLVELNAVQVPGSAPLPRDRGPVATPFSQPAGVDRWQGPVMGDPAPLSAVGGLTPEQVAELEAKADGKDEVLTDEELIAERRYEEAKVPALVAEVEARELEVEGSGDGGRVLKVDLVEALVEDDDEDDE